MRRDRLPPAVVRDGDHLFARRRPVEHGVERVPDRQDQRRREHELDQPERHGEVGLRKRLAEPAQEAGERPRAAAAHQATVMKSIMFCTQKTARAVQRVAARRSGSGRTPVVRAVGVEEDLLVRIDDRLDEAGPRRRRGSASSAPRRPSASGTGGRPRSAAARRPASRRRRCRTTVTTESYPRGRASAGGGPSARRAVLLEETARRRGRHAGRLGDGVVHDARGEEGAVEEPGPVAAGRVVDGRDEVAGLRVPEAPAVRVEAQRPVHRRSFRARRSSVASVSAVFE